MIRYKLPTWSASIVLSCTAAAAACDTQSKPQPSTAAEPATTAAPESEPESRPASGPASKPNEWTFSGPPDPDQGPLLAATGFTATLRDACAPDAEPVGEWEVASGEPVAWEAATTIVTAPFTVKARKDLTVSIAPVAKNRKAADATIDLAVPAGREVGLLKDAGGGSCYVVIESMLGLVDCPGVGEFEADGWEGARKLGEHRWCVTPRGETGWLLVDDHFASD